MTTGRPGLFGRIKNVISSTLGDAVESVSDPGQELALLLDDLQAQIVQAEKDHKQAMVDRKVMERKIAELQAEETAWQGRAEQALRLGDEGLARAALERRTDFATRRTDTEIACAEQGRVVDEMGASIKESKRKLQALNLRRGSLMAQARAARGGGMGAGLGAASGASSKLDEIEGKIAEIEAMNEVSADAHAERIQEAAIDRKLAALSGGSAVDDELEALKAKLRDRAALGDGGKK